MIFFQKQNDINGYEVVPLYVADYGGNVDILVAIESYTTNVYEQGDKCHNAYLGVTGEFLSTTKYPYPCYTPEGEYIGFGDTYGLECLYVKVTDSQGNVSCTHWLIDDCSLEVQYA